MEYKLFNNLLASTEALSELKELPNGITISFADSLFKTSISLATTINKTTNLDVLYFRWLKFTLTFDKEPYKKDFGSNIPASVKKWMNNYWNNSFECVPENYVPLVNSLEDFNLEETISLSQQMNINNQRIFDLSTNINKNIKTRMWMDIIKFISGEHKDIKSLSYKKFIEVYTNKKRPTKWEQTLICKLFQNFYDAEKIYDALPLLDLLPNTWHKNWYGHLCFNSSNNYLDNLVKYFTKNSNIIENQEEFVLQLRLKVLLNKVNYGFDQETELNNKTLDQISDELRQDFLRADIDSFQNEDLLIKKYTAKIYEKVFFDKAKEIYSLTNLNEDADFKLKVYIDLKKIFEFCKNSGLEQTQSYLEVINKTLFKELKDNSSGVSIIIQMLKNKDHEGVIDYLNKILYVVSDTSIDMERLFEQFIIATPTLNLNTSTLDNYINCLSEVSHPQFKMITYLLKLFNEGENNIHALTKVLIKNLSIFKAHSTAFSSLLEVSLDKRFSATVHQELIFSLLGTELDSNLLKKFTDVLIDYFYDQPYKKFSNAYFSRKLNTDTIKAISNILDEKIAGRHLSDEAMLMYEEKFESMTKVRALIEFIIDKQNVGINVFRSTSL